MTRNDPFNPALGQMPQHSDIADLIKGTRDDAAEWLLDTVGVRVPARVTTVSALARILEAASVAVTQGSVAVPADLSLLGGLMANSALAGQKAVKALAKGNNRAVYEQLTVARESLAAARDLVEGPACAAGEKELGGCSEEPPF